MNVWIIASCIFVGVFAAPAWRCCRGDTNDRLVALMFAGEIATLALVAMAAAFHRTFYLDCALAVAILPYPSAIVFATFYEKWL